MRKRFAPLALLFGLFTAMMLASTSMAQANPILPTFTSCTNGVVNVNVVTCNDVLNNITVTITGNRALTGNELTILKDNLNKNKIDIEDVLNVEATKLVVVNTYNSFNPPITITVGNVNICVALICK
jgi:hypothetical protein